MSGPLGSSQFMYSTGAAGFYDYYYCGYYTSYSDSVAMTAGHTYYIVVDGWGGDAGYYNLQVFEHGDTTYTDGWDYDVVTTDPNHDLEQKTLVLVNFYSILNCHPIPPDSIQPGPLQAREYHGLFETNQ